MTTTTKRRALLALVCALLLGLGSATSVLAQARGRAVRGTTHTSVNRNVNANVNRNVNVRRDIDVDIDRDYHPVATAAAIGTTAAVTAAVVGSVAYSLPPACSAVLVGGVTYQQCSGSWYQPRYAGTQMTYVVVDPPR